MGTFRELWKNPQRVWLRKAVFQIHLWSGIGVGIYVLLISISGSAIVFRNEVYEVTESPMAIVERVGERMDHDAIRNSAEKAWPGYEVTQVYEIEGQPARAVEVRMEWGSWVRNRLFDPYTGADLGNAVAWPIRVMAWFQDLHVNLFGGKTGRQINAVGGLLWALLSMTGVVIWWQGIKNWTRGFLVRWRAGWKRFNWDLHSSLGIWTLLLTFMWGITGVFAAIPDPFRAAVDYLEPLRPVGPPPANGTPVGRGALPQQGERTGNSAPAAEQRGNPGIGRRGRPRFQPRIGDSVLRGAYALHFGNFAGVKVKIAWVILGLIPGVLFLTGLLMWVNRVLRKLPLF